MQKQALIIIICTAVLGLIIGCFIGVSYEKIKMAPDIEKANKIIKSLNSSFISSVVVSGKVTNVSDSVVTLGSGENIMKIRVKDNAKIFLIKQQSDGGAPYQEIELKDIEIGDELSSVLKISPNGDLETEIINVFPPSVGLPLKK